MKNLLELKRFQINGVLYMKSPYKEEICNGNEN